MNARRPAGRAKRRGQLPPSPRIILRRLLGHDRQNGMSTLEPFPKLKPCSPIKYDTTGRSREVHRSVISVDPEAATTVALEFLGCRVRRDTLESWRPETRMACFPEEIRTLRDRADVSDMLHFRIIKTSRSTSVSQPDNCNSFEASAHDKFASSDVVLKGHLLMRWRCWLGCSQLGDP